MTRRLLTLAALVLLASTGHAGPGETCQWDGLRKVVWLDDIEQGGVSMAYPLPADLVSRSLAPLLGQADRLVIDGRTNYRNWADASQARLQAQIIVRPRLLSGGFRPAFTLLGAEFGGKTAARLQVALFDNLSQTVLRTLDFGGGRLVVPAILKNTQANLNDQATDIVEGLMEDVAKAIAEELDCMPYAARVTVGHANELEIAGGGRHNIRPRMSFSILAASERPYGPDPSAPINYRRVADVVVTSVSPGASYAQPSIPIGLAHGHLIATPLR